MKRIWIAIGACLVLASCHDKKIASEKVVIEEHPSDHLVEEPIDSFRAGSVEVDADAMLNALQDYNPFQVEKMRIANDSLFVHVQYGGGCKEHEFKLISSGAYAESMPPQLTVLMVHESEPDPCRALIYEQWVFPIQSLRYPGVESLMLHVKQQESDSGTTFEYSY